MADRKAELERKKAKLEQMRAERKKKQETVETTANESTVSSTGSRDKHNETVEDILSNLGIEASNLPVHQPPNASILESPATITSASVESSSSSKKQLTLSASKVTQTNIPPKDLVQYNKETQTPKEPTEKDARPMDYYALTYVDSDEDADSLDVAVDTPPLHHKMPHTTMHKPTETPEDLAAVGSSAVEEKPVIRELTEEERRKIMVSEDFQMFFNRAACIVERALCEDVDIFTDYAGLENEDNTRALMEGEQLKLNRQFYDERWSKHRTVTSLDWSTQFPELLLASYNNNEDMPQEPDGVALIWNNKYKKSTPEFIFHYQSPVTSACFAKFHPNLIIGGTYSGQIVLWDNRSNKRTPIQRTPLSASVHTHPVYCIDVVGTQNAHNLVSVSTDGKMCFWSLDMLSQPQDSMELQHKQSKAVAALCCSFPFGDFNNFVVGSEEGIVYTACRHGSKAGINDAYESHQGPVTGIDCHTVAGPVDFSPYFITSSFDWTVKLWNIKESNPIHSFEDNSEYVYDAKWSPIHPALFSTVDGSGRLDIWNLNVDTEVPTASTVIENNAALNKCRWHKDGHNIAVGDDEGMVHIYDVGEPLAVPRSDDWPKFSLTLQELKLEQAEQEEEQTSIMSQSPMR